MGDGRLLSVALTEDAVVERRKTVTRRLGWWEDRHGRRLVRKAMGRKPGEPVVRLAHVHVVDVARQPLQIRYTTHEAHREGFPDWTWDQFVEFFCREMRCTPATVVTRIEFDYLDTFGPSGESTTWFQEGVAARAAGHPRVRPDGAPAIPGAFGACSWLDGWDAANTELEHEG